MLQTDRQTTVYRIGRTQPCPKKGITVAPQYWAHVYCGQTVGWIKMPLGTVVGVGPGDIVLDGDPKKMGVAAPLFRPMSDVAKQSLMSASDELL